ncbi:tRNA1(Val) (adenine(37)-N6)-methyltransferase [Mesorhizobium yinganensis]|uniref:tRNA1(Val) (adenine(37)-N6)-methyltransferase n=1 Tax=Mesorhizobium yinganensis TaxID=3157707 RepID=UPI0032B747F2
MPSFTDPDTTIDAFHRGRFFLVQQKRGAHRAGMDALVLAAAVPRDFSGLAVDFGAGAGAVGFAVAARCRKASVLLVERSTEMADCAERSIAHPGNSALASRISLLVADVALTGKARAASGLADRSADFVLMNPPFNDGRDRATPDTLRREAHVADENVFEDWLRSAAAVLKPRGRLALIARPASLGPILSALAGRFGGAEVMPIHATADRPAIRLVVRAVRGARGVPSLMPALILHEQADKRFTPRAEAINAGEASLFMD